MSDKSPKIKKQLLNDSNKNNLDLSKLENKELQISDISDNLKPKELFKIYLLIRNKKEEQYQSLKDNIKNELWKRGYEINYKIPGEPELINMKN